MTELFEFEPFPKIPRLNRDMVITEKIDGTSAQVAIETFTEGNDYGGKFGTLSYWMDQIEDGADKPDFMNGATAYVSNGHSIHIIRTGSRNKWITPGKQTDNAGFAAWVADNAQHIVALGHGRHYGEWWGKGIQRGYGLDEKRFSLFNTNRWTDENTPECVSVVPVLYEGPFSTTMVHDVVEDLRTSGSKAAPGFDRPEGVIVFHTALNGPFKVTCDSDEKPKGQA